jgi:short-subunit dehydrogenase
VGIVTGASSGIGWAFAQSLASRGHDLVLVARREDRLRELARLVGERHGVAARVVVADLATDQGLAACREAITAEPAPPKMVVLSAGFGSRGRFWELERERQSAMVRLNCLAVVDLAAHVLPGMVARGSGALVVVSSAAAWQPVPFMATYAATKVFELHLVEAMAEELRGTGVRALAICPGPTRTEFTMSSEAGPAHWWIPFDDVDLVVRSAWRALAAGRRRAVTGPVARGSMLAARILPRGLVLRAAALTHTTRHSLKGSDRPT